MATDASKKVQTSVKTMIDDAWDELSDAAQSESRQATLTITIAVKAVGKRGQRGLTIDVNPRLRSPRPGERFDVRVGSQGQLVLGFATIDTPDDDRGEAE